jgi:hypothetical protein
MATLVDGTGTVVGSTVTGPDGTFVFDDLAAGTYTLTASGYAPVAQVVHVTAGAQAAATVALGVPAAAPAPAAPQAVHTNDGASDVTPLGLGGVR